MNNILKEIKAERKRQIEKHGDQSECTPSYSLPIGSLASAYLARNHCEQAFQNGTGSYLHIFAEEVCEVSDEAMWGTEQALREELIQVAAVCVAWIEKLDK